MNKLNLLRIVRSDELPAEAEETIEKEIELNRPPSTLLDRSHSATLSALEKLKNRESSLQQSIADLSEELRQTRVTIEAYSKAEAIIAAGKVPAAAE